MRRSLPLLLIVPLLAGCTDDPSTDSMGTDSDDVTSELPTEEELLAMDDQRRTETCNDPDIECTITWGEETVETPVEWSGHTKEGVWLLCDGSTGDSPVPVASGCQGQQIQPDGAYQTTVDFEWNLTGVALTLEWSQADPTQTGLALNVQDNTGGASLGTWEGSSTFTVEEDLTADGSTQLLLQVWPVAKDGGGTYIDATQQEFTLTGNILSTRPVITSIEAEWVGETDAA